MFESKEKPLIEFISRIPGLSELEDVKPVPANKFIPQWWKDMPFDLNMDKERYRFDSGMVKQCPAFPDFFSSGYILPMWADTTIYFDKDTGEYRWKCGVLGSPFDINVFEPYKFTNHVNYKYKNKIANIIFQFINPWYIRLPKGYSVMQLPLFYHPTEKYDILPGTYDGHIASSDKLEVAYFTDKEEIFIKKGTPLVQYIPYKKENFNIDIRDQNNNDLKNEHRDASKRMGDFKNWYSQNRNRG
jgi:hypothetical protein